MKKKIILLLPILLFLILLMNQSYAIGNEEMINISLEDGINVLDDETKGEENDTSNEMLLQSKEEEKDSQISEISSQKQRMEDANEILKLSPQAEDDEEIGEDDEEFGDEGFDDEGFDDEGFDDEGFDDEEFDEMLEDSEFQEEDEGDDDEIITKNTDLKAADQQTINSKIPNTGSKGNILVLSLILLFVINSIYVWIQVKKYQF